MRDFLLIIIGIYQKYISPLKPPACRFIPTCSTYAKEAITKYGAMKGSYLTIKRLLKCQPFHKGGYDPIP